MAHIVPFLFTPRSLYKNLCYIELAKEDILDKFDDWFVCRVYVRVFDRSSLKIGNTYDSICSQTKVIVGFCISVLGSIFLNQ